MGQCDASSEPTYKLILLYFCTGVGALGTSSIAFNLAYRWYHDRDRNIRAKVLQRLCAAISISLSMGRIGRIIETWMWYHASGLMGSVFYQYNSIFFVCALGCLMFLLIFQLTTSFEGSIYELDSYKVRRLHILTGSLMIGIYLFITLSNISIINSSVVGSIALGLLALSMLILAVYILVKVDMGFASRLKELVVASNTLHSNKPTVSSLRSRSNTPVGAEEKTFDQMPDIFPQSTFREIRKASVTAYDDTERVLLRTAAKSSVIAIWITVGFLFIGCTAVLIALGAKCASWASIATQVCVSTAYILFDLSVMFCMPQTHDEYEFCCLRCDDWLQRVIAYQTDQQLLSKNNDNNTENNETNGN